MIIMWSSYQENTISSCTMDALELLDLCLLRLQNKMLDDIFLCFWLVDKIRKAMIYNSSMPGDLKPLTRDPYPKGKEAKMLNDP